MAKVEFTRVETNEEVENLDIKDGRFIVTGEGKAFIDYGENRVGIGGTPDTQMNDSSTNSVENRVIKQYVDNEIEDVKDLIPNFSNTYGTSNENGYTQEYINKLETYSTDEIRIGTLINKPIYRKVFQIPEITNQYTTNISSLSIENLVNIYGSLQTGTGSENDRVPLSTWFSASYNVATTVKVGTGTLNVAWNGWSKLYSGIVVLEYTKTTD